MKEITKEIVEEIQRDDLYWRNKDPEYVVKYHNLVNIIEEMVCNRGYTVKEAFNFLTKEK
tara:strand:- start:9904 stop:10083 length:180 start_codon:yes stop_codon:yes gene_type:complete